MQGDQGAEAHPTRRFQVGELRQPAVRPEGRRDRGQEVTRLANPAVDATVTAKSGEAAIASAA